MRCYKGFYINDKMNELQVDYYIVMRCHLG